MSKLISSNKYSDIVKKMQPLGIYKLNYLVNGSIDGIIIFYGKIKKDTEEKLNIENKKLNKNDNFLSRTNLYFNETWLKIKAKLSEIWEKFKDKIIPALIISFVYYIIWLIFFKVIPTILKYLISVAQQFKQP